MIHQGFSDISERIGILFLHSPRTLTGPLGFKLSRCSSHNLPTKTVLPYEAENGSLEALIPFTHRHDFSFQLQWTIDGPDYEIQQIVLKLRY